MDARKPFRITFEATGCIPSEQFGGYVAHASKSGIPFVERILPSAKKLAIVGGGPSIKDTLSRLGEFDDVWGINNAAQWVKQQTGINAALFTVDPADDPGMCAGIERAYLGACVHPKMYTEYLKGKDVKLFHTSPDSGEEFFIGGGTSSACRAPMLALVLGFNSVTFFGCEGSYRGSSHAYENRPRARMVIRATGQDFITQSDFYMQCEYLSDLIKQYPQVFKEESGGLLRGMIQDPEWEVVAFDGEFAKLLGGTDLPVYTVQESVTA